MSSKIWGSVRLKNVKAELKILDFTIYSPKYRV